MNSAEFRAARARRDMTQQAFADHIGASKSSVQKWEAGKKIPKPVALLLRQIGLIADADISTASDR